MKYSVFIALFVCLLLSGCADPNPLTGVDIVASRQPVGFLHGLWHGICAPFSVVGILFGMNIGMYDAVNTGNWYNFGFLLGLGLMGTPLGARRRE